MFRLFLELTKGKRRSIPTLIVDTLATRKQLQRDFLEIIRGNIPLEFLGHKFWRLKHENDDSLEENSCTTFCHAVYPYFNMYYNVVFYLDTYRFYCNQVGLNQFSISTHLFKINKKLIFVCVIAIFRHLYRAELNFLQHFVENHSMNSTKSTG